MRSGLRGVGGGHRPAVKRRRPRAVRVGAHTYTVRVDPSVPSEHLGDYWNVGQIRLQPGLTPSRQREVLFHEVLHAAYEAAKLPASCIEERAVTALAPILLEVLRRNPTLVAYLLEKS